MGVDAGGLRAEARRIKRAAALVPKVAKTVVAKTIKDGQAVGQQVAPVDTGYHRSRIESQMTGPTTGEITANADYSVFLEGGTAFMSPRPSIGPATERVSPAFFAASAQIVAVAFGRVG